MILSNGEYTGAAIIDEVSPDLQFIGYAQNGSPLESEPKWAIKRIEKTGNITRIMWPEGLQGKQFVWDDRGVLNYQYKK